MSLQKNGIALAVDMSKYPATSEEALKKLTKELINYENEVTRMARPDGEYDAIFYVMEDWNILSR